MRLCACVRSTADAEMSEILKATRKHVRRERCGGQQQQRPIHAYTQITSRCADLCARLKISNDKKEDACRGRHKYKQGNINALVIAAAATAVVVVVNFVSINWNHAFPKK